MTKNLGELLASDDEVPVLKPRSKAAQVAKQAQGRGSNDPQHNASEKRHWIVLEENDNIPPTGQFISCNGRTWMLRPGEPVQVPAAVVNVLDDAVQEMPQIDPSTKQVIGYRKRLRFPYRFVSADYSV